MFRTGFIGGSDHPLDYSSCIGGGEKSQLKDGLPDFLTTWKAPLGGIVSVSPLRRPARHCFDEVL